MPGRLIQRLKCRLYQLDTDTQAGASGFDDVFREPVRTDPSGDGIGTVTRTERAAVTVPCQVGTRTWEQKRHGDLGDDPTSDVVLYFDAADLEAAGLYDVTTQRPLIQNSTRLDAILTYLAEDVMLNYGDDLYCEEATPSSWGLNMANPKIKLLRCVFRRRKKTAL